MSLLPTWKSEWLSVPGTFTCVPHCPLPGPSGQPGSLDPIHGFAHEPRRWAGSQRKNLDLPTPMFSVPSLWPLRLVLSSQPQPYDQPQGVSSCPLPWWLLRGPVSPEATSRDRTLLPLCRLPGEDSVPSLCAHNGSFLKLPEAVYLGSLSQWGRRSGVWLPCG